MPTQRRRKRQKLIKPQQAIGGIYVDFEGRAVDGQPPVLLGVLADGELHQFVFDEKCSAVDGATGGFAVQASIELTLNDLLNRSDTEGRHLISWSTHDRTVIRQQIGNRPFRWRNAIRTAKRWRVRQEQAGAFQADPDADNDLRRYESLIGYERPHEAFGVGAAIAYIQQRRSVTAGAQERWQTILQHNEHDLRAMQAVVHTSLGLDLPEDGTPA